MHKQVKAMFLSVLLGIFVISSSGCVALVVGAAAGATGVVYVKGSLVRNFDDSVETMYEASVAALKELDTYIMSEELNRHSAVVKAEYEDGKDIRIDVEALTEKASKVKIRIGTFGDEERSRIILNKIQSNL